MLKTKPLTQLLSQSLSPNVTTALLFTPSGSLLATGTSPIAPDAKKARTHAALAANIWAAYSRVLDDDVTSLTLELSECNLHIALVAPRVLLCLLGGRREEGALGLLKAQAEALVRYLMKELKGFELPEGL